MIIQIVITDTPGELRADIVEIDAESYVKRGLICPVGEKYANTCVFFEEGGGDFRRLLIVDLFTRLSKFVAAGLKLPEKEAVDVPKQ